MQQTLEVAGWTKNRKMRQASFFFNKYPASCKLSLFQALFFRLETSMSELNLILLSRLSMVLPACCFD